MAIARELYWPLHHLTGVLNALNGRGRPRPVWRIGTRLGGSDDLWPSMRDRCEIAIGWPELGDLGWVDERPESLERLKQALDERFHRPDQSKSISPKASEIRDFVRRMADGDLVLACDEQRVLGIGRLTAEPYRYDLQTQPDAPHLRPVHWLDVGDWTGRCPPTRVPEARCFGSASTPRT